MSLLIGFLTFVLVVNCLLLILLVLVQLPKKEAGAGLAFGAGAVDTLIGAGSGNALTKMTKYAAGIFLGLGLLLAMLNAQRHSGTSGIQRELARKASATPAIPTTSVSAPATGPLNTNLSVPAANSVQSTNGPVISIPQNTQTPAPTTPQAQPQP
jgi:protein translocase SecG subunit